MLFAELYALGRFFVLETELRKERNRMSKLISQTVIWTALALTVALGVARPASADRPPDHHGKIIVEDVWATPAGEGGHSVLRLRVINEGHDHAHLLSIETPVAKTARIVGRVSDHKTATFDSMNVRADSELDLTTDHMWIDIGPLIRAVKPGESFPFELVFSRSRLRAEAHVHGADG